MMQLSGDTRDVLKNFSTINQNLMVKSGNTINTMSAMKNIVAKATIPDTFSNEFAIYDLNEFLSALSLFKSPSLDFADKSVKLNEEGGGSSLNYFFSDPSVVTTPKTEITTYSVELTAIELQAVYEALGVISPANYSSHDVRRAGSCLYAEIIDTLDQVST